MAILSNGWYKGSIPFYEITEVFVATTGSGAESWDGSTAQDGSIMCYRSGTKVSIACGSVTAVEEKAFYKFLALKKVSGLSAVTTIGAYAFCYTPNLASIDIVPGNLASIGASAFRMSSAEDVLDLSSVSLSNVGDMATRNKRWSASALSAVRNVVFPKTIYFDVPNSENQGNYPDIPFGTDNGEALTVESGGCTSLACYHIWNYIHAGTDKQYGNYLEWYNATINKNGDFAENNMMDGNTEPSMIAELGWTDSGNTMVNDAAQLQTIIDRLLIGYPTYATMHSVNSVYTHVVVIVGCNVKTHKLAVIDSHVVGTSGVVSWLSFEDIFVGGSAESDRIRVIDYKLPILAPNSTWFTQGGTTVAKSTITQIDIKDTYAPSGTVKSSWDASAAKDGSITAYVEGTKLILAGNGAGKIGMNADSSNVFNGFSKMISFNGANVLFASKVTTLAKAFYDCMVLKNLDLNGWNTSNVVNLESAFNGMLALESVNVGNWNTSNVTNMKTVFQCCPKITELDLSNWTTDNVTTLNGIFSGVTNYGGAMALTNISGIENWDTSKVTNMGSVFQNCTHLKNLNVSGWDTGACTDMSFMFGSDSACILENIDVSRWNTSKVTTMKSMFQRQSALTFLDFSNWNTFSVTNMSAIFNNCNSLKKIILGEKFSFNGNGSATGSNVAVIPTPNSANIPGADGNWYDVNGNAIAPSTVPDKTFGVYYATPAIAEEDMNQMVLVNKKNLMLTAAAIRTKTGSTKGFAPDEFADAILSN